MRSHWYWKRKAPSAHLLSLGSLCLKQRTEHDRGYILVVKAKIYLNQGKAKNPLCRQEQAPASIWPKSPIFHSTGKGGSHRSTGPVFIGDHARGCLYNPWDSLNGSLFWLLSPRVDFVCFSHRHISCTFPLLMAFLTMGKGGFWQGPGLLSVGPFQSSIRGLWGEK